MLERKPATPVSVALAKRMAQVVRALIATGDSHRPVAA
jgi:hypothetical protein